MANTDRIEITTYHTFDVTTPTTHKDFDAALAFAATRINIRISVFNLTTGTHAIFDKNGRSVARYTV